MPKNEIIKPKYIDDLESKEVQDEDERIYRKCSKDTSKLTYRPNVAVEEKEVPNAVIANNPFVLMPSPHQKLGPMINGNRKPIPANGLRYSHSKVFTTHNKTNSPLISQQNNPRSDVLDENVIQPIIVPQQTALYEKPCPLNSKMNYNTGPFVRQAAIRVFTPLPAEKMPVVSPKIQAPNASVPSRNTFISRPPKLSDAESKAKQLRKNAQPKLIVRSTVASRGRLIAQSREKAATKGLRTTTILTTDRSPVIDNKSDIDVARPVTDTQIRIEIDRPIRISPALNVHSVNDHGESNPSEPITKIKSKSVVNSKSFIDTSKGNKQQLTKVPSVYSYVGTKNKVDDRKAYVEHPSHSLYPPNVPVRPSSGKFRQKTDRPIKSVGNNCNFIAHENNPTCSMSNEYSPKITQELPAHFSSSEKKVESELGKLCQQGDHDFTKMNSPSCHDNPAKFTRKSTAYTLSFTDEEQPLLANPRTPLKKGNLSFDNYTNIIHKVGSETPEINSSVLIVRSAITNGSDANQALKSDHARSQDKTFVMKSKFMSVSRRTTRASKTTSGLNGSRKHTNKVSQRKSVLVNPEKELVDTKIPIIIGDSMMPKSRPSFTVLTPNKDLIRPIIGSTDNNTSIYEQSEIDPLDVKPLTVMSMEDFRNYALSLKLHPDQSKMNCYGRLKIDSHRPDKDFYNITIQLYKKLKKDIGYIPYKKNKCDFNSGKSKSNYEVDVKRLLSETINLGRDTDVDTEYSVAMCFSQLRMANIEAKILAGSNKDLYLNLIKTSPDLLNTYDHHCIRYSLADTPVELGVFGITVPPEDVHIFWEFARSEGKRLTLRIVERAKMTTICLALADVLNKCIVSMRTNGVSRVSEFKVAFKELRKIVNYRNMLVDTLDQLRLDLVKEFFKWKSLCNSTSESEVATDDIDDQNYYSIDI